MEKGKKSLFGSGIHFKYNMRMLGFILLILLFNMLLQGFFTWRSISDEQMSRKRMESNVKNEKVEAMKKNVERIIDNSVTAIEQQLDDTQQCNQLLLSLLQNNPELLGATLAFIPNYHPEKGRLYSPYVYRDGEAIRLKVLTHDYTTTEWFQNCVNTRKRGWCNPYADNEVSFVVLTSYSVPLYDKNNKVVAVLTGDLPLSLLTIENGDIYHKTSMRTLIILGMLLFSFLLIICIAVFAVRDMKRMDVLRKEEEHASYELGMATRIQDAIIPKSLPQHPHLSISANLEPALEVSGDFYECLLRDNKLYFCIADIATQGLGASMAMLVTRTVYMVCVNNHQSISSMMNTMNNSLVGINERQMYATLLTGELDLETGVLTYCNAGHLPPYLLKAGSDAEAIEIIPNVPMGIVEWEYQEQKLQMHPGDTIFFYTDGIIEAMNPQEGSFGEKRLALHLKNAANNSDNPSAVIKRITTALHHHIGIERRANDDLTMFALRYE